MTLPKLRLDGLADKVPAAAVPVPESGTDNGEFEASEVIVRLPLAVPTAFGANVTVAVVLCDWFRVIGVVMPLS